MTDKAKTIVRNREWLDKFAAAALTGLLSYPSEFEVTDWLEHRAGIALSAYQYAEAVMKIRDNYKGWMEP